MEDSEFADPEEAGAVSLQGGEVGSLAKAHAFICQFQRTSL